VPFLGRVPLAASVRIGGDSGHPVVADDPDSPAGQAFHELAKAVAAQVSMTLLTNKNVIPINVIK
jgi:ATP-binding protein involved in chromosome partitioning